MKLSMLAISLLITATSFAYSDTDSDEAEVYGAIEINDQIDYKTSFKLAPQTIAPGQKRIDIPAYSSGPVGACVLKFPAKSHTRNLSGDKWFEVNSVSTEAREITDEDLRNDLIKLGLNEAEANKLESREELLVKLGQLGGKLTAGTRNFVHFYVSSDTGYNGDIVLTCEANKPVTNISKFIEQVGEVHTQVQFDRSFP